VAVPLALHLLVPYVLGLYLIVLYLMVLGPAVLN
jgi:hypothetical protein